MEGESSGEYDDSDDSCLTPSSNSSSNGERQQPVDAPSCVMPTSKKVEEDKVSVPVKEPAKLSSSLQMKRLEKNNQEIIKSKGLPPPGD